MRGRSLQNRLAIQAAEVERAQAQRALEKAEEEHRMTREIARSLEPRLDLLNDAATRFWDAADPGRVILEFANVAGRPWLEKLHDDVRACMSLQSLA